MGKGELEGGGVCVGEKECEGEGDGEEEGEEE